MPVRFTGHPAMGVPTSLVAPFLLAAVIVIHLAALHHNGSTDPIY